MISHSDYKILICVSHMINMRRKVLLSRIIEDNHIKVSNEFKLYLSNLVKNYNNGNYCSNDTLYETELDCILQDPYNLLIYKSFTKSFMANLINFE